MNTPISPIATVNTSSKRLWVLASVGCSGTPRVQGGLLCQNTPIVLPTSLLLTPLPKGYGLALEAPARRRGRLCAGVTWRATDWIHLFTMHAYFLARKVGGRKMDPELRVEPSLGHRKRLFVKSLDGL